MRQIETEILERFKKIVETHIGLNSSNEDPLFRKTLIALMKESNITRPEEYLSLLESNTNESKQEWIALTQMVTTGESYFFRDNGHFHLLQNKILPELIKKKQPQRSLRIWSAGCSSGEEPYSIAILLDMLLPDPEGWEIVILGTDINSGFLKKARRGIYSDWSFRMVDKDIQQKYFSRHADGWEINERFKQRIKFQHANLMETGFFTHYTEICNMDIIICRNVFIYFNRQAVSSVFNNFTKILNNDGYLITGHGELYGLNITGLLQILSPEAVIYKKTVELIAPISANAMVPERIKEDKKLNIKSDTVVGSELPVAKAKTRLHNQKIEIKKVNHEGRYSEVNEKVGTYNLANENEYCILLSLARDYANSGDYGKAESCCKKAIEKNYDSAYPYFLLAQIAEAKGNDEAAKDLLNKAIYLNPTFIAAYCEIGSIYERNGEHVRAVKFRNTASDLLRSLPSHSLVNPYNISAAELLEAISTLIKS